MDEVTGGVTRRKGVCLHLSGGCSWMRAWAHMYHTCTTEDNRSVREENRSERPIGEARERKNELTDINAPYMALL